MINKVDSKYGSRDYTKYNNMYFDIAKRVAAESQCERRKVGCVVLTTSGMIATGFNGMASGQPDKWHNPDDEYHESNRNVVHAELNALGKMLEQGVSAKDAVVYLTLSPCLECAKLLVRSRVKEVNILEEYRSVEGIKYLVSNGVAVNLRDNSYLNKQCVGGLS